jgi:hypothetical protein
MNIKAAALRMLTQFIRRGRSWPCTGPAEAFAWQKAHEGTMSSIPVLESDGTTQIGDFTVGG